MKNSVAVWLLSMCVFALPSPGRADSREYTIDPSQSTLAYAFRSTLHPVHGRATEFAGSFFIYDENTPVLESGSVTVSSASLNSQNKKRDRNTRGMLESDRYPAVRYNLSSISDIQQEEGNAYAATLHGQLTIRDVSQNVDAEARIKSVPQGYEIIGSAPVSLTAFGLKPPSVLGVIRVFDPVTVEFDIVVRER